MARHRPLLVLVLTALLLTVPLTGCMKRDSGGDDEPGADVNSPDPDDSGGSGTPPATGTGSGSAGTGTAQTGPTTPESPRPSGNDGATAPPAGAGVSLTITPGAASERVTARVDDVGGDFTWRRVVVRVDDAQYTFGSTASASGGQFAVDGVTNPDTAVAAGHVMRAPAAGDVSVVLLLSPSGTRLAQFTMSVPDDSPPGAPQPTEPADGSGAGDGDDAADGDDESLTLAWLPVEDASAVTYEVQYAWDAVYSNPSRLNGIAGTTAPLPLDALPAPLSDGTLVPLHWRVRATDGEGHVGPWSTSWTLFKLPDATDALPGAVTGAVPQADLPVPDLPVLDLETAASGKGLDVTLLGLQGTLLLKDLAFRVDGTYYTAEGTPFAGGQFTVTPPRDPSFPLAPGDTVTVPVAGDALPVEVTHLPTGHSLDEVTVTVPDGAAPASPLPLDPLAGEVAEGPVALRWTASPDPSGVTYDVVVTTDPLFGFGAGIHGAYGLPDTTAVTDLAALPVPPEAEAEPKTVYWSVRAVDGAGNASPWSPLVPLSV